jgi:hypothetical protein
MKTDVVFSDWLRFYTAQLWIYAAGLGKYFEALLLFYSRYSLAAEI